MLIPAKLRIEVLKILHQGHLGIVKTKSKARDVAWWLYFDKEIEAIIMECTHCGLVKPVA